MNDMTQIAAAQSAVRAAQRDLDDALAAQRLELAREAEDERRQRRDAVVPVAEGYVPSVYRLESDPVWLRMCEDRDSA